ncbi:hypothetical protein [Flavobacterium sp. N2038]|uniref:hypothetical protein n=1 Tax=Flavobacterium sp. N2038 TaxID=2986829 RepID=UPI002225AE8F|nr:hypothetical protein [Flavobacterium sp. N2038]
MINFNNCFFGQLSKVPVLIQHYTEHQERSGGLAFSDFIAMHYLGQDINDNDEDRDMQLPFKKVDPHSQHVVFIPSRIYTSILTLISLDAEFVNNYKTNLHANPYLGSLFRPPIV